VRRGAGPLTARAWRRVIAFGGRRSEVNVPLQHVKRVAKRRQLGVAFRGGEQIGFQHAPVVKFWAATSCRTREFFEVSCNAWLQISIKNSSIFKCGNM
jgi:hypothetical protein